MTTRPSGTVTFLFSDIEGSTRRWEHDPESMGAGFSRQEAILRGAMEAQGGYVYKMIGDAFQVAFNTPLEAVKAALEAQFALIAEPWGEMGVIKVRMAIHTGTVEERGDDYVGPLLNRVARLMSAGHGGQVLLSQATYELVRDILPENVSLRDLGEQRLKDLARPERVYQLVAPGLDLDYPQLNTLDAYTHNLPLQLDRFIGREDEIEEVKGVFNTSRLVTLTGSGGAGKTRLALHIAADLVEAFEDGVWLVDLAPLSDPALVPQSVATALSLSEEWQRDLFDILSDYLNDKHLLIILDNCEHLVDACAQLADRLLRTCPGLVILATSREALRIPGERTYPVSSLKTPDPRYLPEFESLSQYEAVQLFIDRAVSAVPTFRIDNKNAPALAQICYRLDGIPLAIELAAARVRAMSLETIAARLEDSFHLLTRGTRTVLPRHQTLEAAIDWSYNSLSEDERTLFRRCAVFPGGCSLEAAETVCCGGSIEACDVMELLTSLVDKSLLQVDYSHGETRYRMLNTVRQHALEKIDGDEFEDLRTQFIQFFLVLAEGGEQKAKWGGEHDLPKKLAADLDNFRVALAWSLEDLDSYGDTALRMAGSLYYVCWTTGYLNEGRRWTERALSEIPDIGEPRAKALTNASCIAWAQGDYSIAEVYSEESISIYRNQATEDLRGLANAIHIMGHVIFDQKDFIQGRAYFEESLSIFRQLEDKISILTLASDLGMVDYHEGDYPSAKKHYQECLEIARQGDDLDLVSANLLRLGEIARLEGDYETASALYEESRGILSEVEWNLFLAGNLHKLGFIAQYREDYQGAKDLFTQSLEMQEKMSNRQGIAECLAGLAGLAVISGKIEQGVRLFAGAQALLDDIGAPMAPADCVEMERELSLAREQLSEVAFSTAWSEGGKMSMEEAIASARNLHPA
jgi:predicted ATPase/class 3 adenylate cyclase